MVTIIFVILFIALGRRISDKLAQFNLSHNVGRWFCTEAEAHANGWRHVYP